MVLTRHPVLILVLILVILFNIMLALSVPYFHTGLNFWEANFFRLLGVLAMLNSIFAIAMWYWRKWGFYGYLTNSLIVVAISIGQAKPWAEILSGLFGVLIVFIALHLGGENKAWNKMH